jgi:hypothetical protein
MLFGGETEVEVLQGKVRGRTPQTEMVISAGQKGLVRDGQNPIVAVKDPLVQEAIQMYRWIEEEKAAGNPVKNATIFVAALDEEQAVRSAILVAYSNDGSEATSTIPMGPVTALKDLRIYDFEGNLLRYDTKTYYENSLTYLVHLPNPIEPGETIGYIAVSPSIERLYWLSKGPVWSVTAMTDFALKPMLCLGKIILPKSAILLGAYPEALLTDTVEDRIALTFRIEEAGNTKMAFSFLWPNKDGTTLENVPPEMRGLQDPQQARIIKNARKEMSRIIDGQRFSDHSTPMNSFLSGVSDLFHDLDKTAQTAFSDPLVKKASKGGLEQVKEFMIQVRNELVHTDLHSCSLPPAEPKQGDITWIKFKHKGTFKSTYTAEYIYMDSGQWKFHASDLLSPPSSK